MASNDQSMRNRVVKDWRKRNHTQREMDGIELYLNSGDPKYLPNMYKSSHDHWFPITPRLTNRRLVIFMAKGKKVNFWAKGK